MSDDDVSDQQCGRRALLAALGASAGLSTVATASGTDTGDDGTRREQTDAGGRAGSASTDATLYVGAGERVYAVDATTGTQEWISTEPDESVVSSPTVVDGTVYVGATGDLNQHAVYALDAESGDDEWVFDDPSFPVESSPTVVDGTVYVGANDGTVYAIDAASGDSVWQFTVEDTWIPGSPMVFEGTVYIGTRDSGSGGSNALYALDAASGDLVWEFTDPDSSIVSSPTLTQGTLYVASRSVLYALDPETGMLQREFSGPSWGESSPTVVDGTLYIASDGSENAVYAIDTETFETLWQFEFPGFSGERSSPTVVDGILYIGSSGSGSDQFYALDADTGDEVWSIDTEETVTSPTVWNGLVYVGTDDEGGTIHARDAETGEAEWLFDDPGLPEFSSSPTVAVDGESAGSRVRLGTLGHHHEWARPTAAVFSWTPSIPDPGEAVSLDGSTSTGPLEGYEWDLTDDGATDAEGESATATFEEEGGFDVTLTVTDLADVTDTTTETVYVGTLPPLPGFEKPPGDLNDDGLYEDIDGDGEFTIFDVQALFNNLDSDPVQNHPEAFNFSGDDDPDQVTIFDVQGLFNRLAGWE